MKTLFVSYRVTDLDRSLGFYTALGYVELGRVQGTGFDHLAIQVDTLAATLEPGPVQYPGGPRGPKTSWLTDPDGYRIELVEWPPGHPGGITAADFS
ncbi:VOC family protein [Streptomyces fractus]|uniref:VOC family protein n=1 Tax=Streptomyces fractus TaxID=641806 RepID=UPI003CF10C14